jgi:Zn-finger nucleic acid-binding protein
MKEVEINKVEIDICEDCGGVWFDNLEFEKFDEVQESAGDQLVNLLAGCRKKPVDLSQRVNCPRCPDTVLMRHFESALRKIAIDQCPSCGGIWLDAGELAEYRKLFPGEEDKKKVNEEFIAANIMPLLKKEAQKEEEKLKQAQRFANVFRFVCPSYYIPGKQEGAAF